MGAKISYMSPNQTHGGAGCFARCNLVTLIGMRGLEIEEEGVRQL